MSAWDAEHAHDAAVAILVQAPTISVALAILLGWKAEARVMSTSPLLMGISTGPRLKNGCPKASTRLPSL